MQSSDIEDLVSQAEELGVTLAEVMASSLSPRELDLLQSELQQSIVSGYKEIEDFMSDVSVPSIEEILTDEQFTPLVSDLEEELPLSDDSEQFVDYA